MELLEVERLNEFQSKMAELKKLEFEWVAQMPQLSQSLETSIQAMDLKKEMRLFVESSVQQHGLPPVPPPFQSQLATTSTIVAEDTNNLKSLLLANSTGLSPLTPDANNNNPVNANTVRFNSNKTSGGNTGNGINSNSTIFTNPNNNNNNMNNNPDPFDRAKDPPTTYVKAIYDFQSEDEGKINTI